VLLSRYATAALALGNGKHAIAQLLPTPAFHASTDAAQRSLKTGPCRWCRSSYYRYWYEVQPANLERRPERIETILKNAQIINVGAGPAPGKLHTQGASAASTRS